MRIENYEIEPYEYGYMVSEIQVVKDEKSKNFWQETKTNTKYPADLIRALEMVRGNIRAKHFKDTLESSIFSFIEIDRKFLEDLTALLKS